MNRTIFRLSDEKLKTKGRIPIQFCDAEYWNNKGYGIFWSVNIFKNGCKRYTSENIAEINSWFCELDGDIESLETYIMYVALYPSWIIRTKNGFHLYWFAKEGTTENYSEIQERIQYSIKRSDPRCKDIARILRVPGFNHLKDKDDPFLVYVYDNSGNEYTEKEMKRFFIARPEQVYKSSDFSKAPHIDSFLALDILSGTDFVDKEIYTLKRNSNNTYQIIVNGAITSCWIDEKGFIGSHDGGGPTIVQWLKWYGLSGNKLRQSLDYIRIKLGQKPKEV